jgi:hypothetical protein
VESIKTLGALMGISYDPIFWAQYPMAIQGI